MNTLHNTHPRHEYISRPIYALTTHSLFVIMTLTQMDIFIKIARWYQNYQRKLWLRDVREMSDEDLRRWILQHIYFDIRPGGKNTPKLRSTKEYRRLLRALDDGSDGKNLVGMLKSFANAEWSLGARWNPDFLRPGNAPIGLESGAFSELHDLLTEWGRRFSRD